MVFIGLRAARKDPETGLISGGTGAGGFKSAPVIHFNPSFIKLVNEKTMVLTMDDGSEYRIDDESLQIFLAAMYGEQKLRGDKLEEQ